MSSKPKVLVVDDDQYRRRLMSQVLSAGDRIEVVCAADFVDAIITLEDPSLNIGCILSDYEIPGGMDGVEFLQYVRTHPTLPFTDIPFFLNSNNLTHSVEERARAGGVSGSFDKSEIDHITEAIYRALDAQ